tara:strand:- start:734 stop:1351 length:618 start_codon:yes stop_codon:yes gene_type:complete
MKIGLNIGAGIGESNYLFSDFDIVHCFEPNIFSFDILKKLDSDNLILHNYGISDIDGHKTFNNFDAFSYSSLLDLDTTSEFYEHCTQVDKGFGDYMWKTDIKVKRLDTFIKENNINSINLIKIDTQGHDLNVVKSLGNYINIIDTIVLECQLKPLYKNSYTKEEIILYMNNNNFNLINTEKNYTTRIEYCDISFEENLTFKNNKI